jgi:hypothetical protein
MALLKPLTLKHQEKKEQTSLGLRALLDSLGDAIPGGILDLGPAVGSNVDFFSKLSSSFYVADLFRALESDRPAASTDEMQWDPVFEKILPYEDDARFDLILAWDVLNYLRAPQIEALARCLGPHCSRGTVLFAMISTRKQIPARPRSYQVLSSEKLLYQTPTQAVRPCPSYKEPDLLRMLTGFHVKTSYLLRNGMLEYLFTYE